MFSKCTCRIIDDFKQNLKWSVNVLTLLVCCVISILYTLHDQLTWLKVEMFLSYMLSFNKHPSNILISPDNSAKQGHGESDGVQAPALGYIPYEQEGGDTHKHWAQGQVSR